MKKTININLAGYPFIIDDDAYSLLKDYLDTIRYAFDTQEDTEDLTVDIENRVAEILTENERDGVRIVTVQEISQVIERIGKPSDFIEMEEINSEEKENFQESEQKVNTENETVSPPPYDQYRYYSELPRKKLFRDPQNAMLGGVCSGMAAYFNLDPAIVRLLTIVLFFLSASVVAIAYIILWIVLPEARTPFQRMQMKGETPTMENIGKSITENYEENNSSLYQKENLQKRTGFWKFIYDCCSVFVKFFIILGLFIAIPIVFALAIVIIACIVAIFGAGIGTLGDLNFGNEVSPGSAFFYLLLATIGALITIGIPLWLLYARKFKKRDITATINNRRSLVFVWIAGIALVSVFTPKTVRAIQKYETYKDVVYEIIDDNIDEDLEIDENDEVSVSPKGVTIKKKNGKIIDISSTGIKVVSNKDKVERIHQGDTIKAENIQIVATESVQDSIK